MTDRTDVVSPWNDLAGRALRHAVERRTDIAHRCVIRLAAIHGDDCIPQVLLAWMDTAIAVAFPDGPPPPEKFGGMVFQHVDTGQRWDVDSVPPPVRWAGRLWAARIADDEDQGRALLASVEDDRQWAENVAAVLNVCSSVIRLVQSGGRAVES